MILVVTGTDTGVGKTIVTAALAARASGSVIVVKPVQTGISGAEIGDVDVVHRLTGKACQEFTTLVEPLAPDTAARLEGVQLPLVAEHADRIRVLAQFHDLVIVEGAGGVLVRLDAEGGTIADLAAGLGADVYVVTRAGLGTLNHTGLTVEALRSRGIEPRALVIGCWPAEPGLVETTNLEDLLTQTRVPLLGVLPEGAGDLGRDDFLAQAQTWLTAPLR
jgi:dethiobiotin synthetase